jgi:hypothetical protein
MNFGANAFSTRDVKAACIARIAEIEAERRDVQKDCMKRLAEPVRIFGFGPKYTPTPEHVAAMAPAYAHIWESHRDVAYEFCQHVMQLCELLGMSSLVNLTIPELATIGMVG